MLRRIIIVLLSLGILAGGYLGFKKLSVKPESNRQKPAAPVKGVYARVIENAEIPLNIISSGMLEATRQVQLTSEVTGVLQSSRFKEGVAYNKGQVIFTIDNSEADANVSSQRSSFYAKLLNVMPDLKLDYPEVWSKWDAYLNSIDVQKSLPGLPDFSNDRERNFITANGIVTSYQAVKNLEIRSGKFVIRAPFNGVITAASVQEGGLIRQGQPLGEISSLGDYELELPVNLAYLEYLKVGRKIELTPIEGTGSYTGEIVRINPRADVSSQSIIAYVRVVSKSLREGMYLQADMDAGVISDASEIDRKLINNKKEVFIVINDTLLSKTTVEPVYYQKETAIVKGLEDGVVLVSKPVPGAYGGMKVRILNSGQPAQ
ncbi:MAG: HlyD family efflux transporter periplasmic adaptor subunit [Bacteroidetes bacterium]|nr:HlyD family efflux transporter periplasmic adaptor subunit [Bacteroidota bacterium]